jgi:hypothetical protein
MSITRKQPTQPTTNLSLLEDLEEVSRTGSSRTAI